MDPKLLTESGLKAILSKHKIKDNGLQRALATYDKLDDDAHDECLETIAQIGKLATALKKVKDVAANKAVASYLDDLLDAADGEEKDVTKAKSAAAKTDAANQKKADKEKEKDEEDEGGEEEEELQGEYGERLLTALKKLKSMNGKPMKFIVCDARPYCGLAIGKRIGTNQKEELTELTGGSKRFLKPATCFWDGDQYVFEPEQMVPGLAKKLVRSVKNFTGKKFRMVVGDESAGGEDEGEDETPETETGEATESRGPQVEEEAGAGGTAPETTTGEQQQPEGEAEEAPAAEERYKPEPIAPPTLGKGSLDKAPDVWHQTRKILETNIAELKKAVQDEYSDAHPDLLKQINTGVSKLDAILQTLDQRLADSLSKAHKAGDPAAKKNELKNSKAILVDYLKYVKSEPLIAHIDANPFGVSTNIKKILTDSLTHMAQAIG